MESELPTLLYQFYFALAATALVLALRTFGLQKTIQIRSNRRSDLNAILSKS
ncbi:hypothetical protein SAMN05444358_101572 [Ruegeria halocynthiae]|uniref:Uncharacterized protein n=1 Tax=Ruegeria halocynthiae TaxID=985054 RepID=A0A1H2ST60_9RHOB|nr:hypothetical protein SAMN05444358_101572 [Ruegeria halocynthiae]